MVDYSSLYAIGFMILTISLIFGASYFRTRNIIKIDDLKIVSNLLHLGIPIIEEMNLKQEKDISKIANIIVLSLDNTINIVKLKDKEKIIKQSKIFTYQLCEKNLIELTDTRKELINQLIEITLNSKYGDIIMKE